MTVPVILVALFAIFGTGFLIWSFWRNDGAITAIGAPIRRREDARDWQRKFGADSLLASNFFQPTQNEILETLYVLDHLTPGWERDHAGAPARHFLNELALTFPTLRRTPCIFPLPFTETLAAAGGSEASEREIADKREAYRISRAQFNALEQIAAGSASPAEGVAGSLPFRLSEAAGPRPARNLRPVRVAGAAMLFAAVLGTVLYVPRRTNFASDKEQGGRTFEPPTEVTATAGEPSPVPIETKEPVAAVLTPSAPAAPAVPAAAQSSPPLPPVSPDKEKLAHEQQVAASQQRAVDKYPALAIQGSEINLRFVFRYKNLAQENSARLLDPNWPEQLAEECAAASGMSPKRNAFTQVRGTPR